MVSFYPNIKLYKNVEVYMDGYMTIGEVAKVKQISIKALRYYEKIGILKPAYCDPDTGYRYYKNEQMLAIEDRKSVV